MNAQFGAASPQDRTACPASTALLVANAGPELEKQISPKALATAPSRAVMHFHGACAPHRRRRCFSYSVCTSVLLHTLLLGRPYAAAQLHAHLHSARHSICWLAEAAHTQCRCKPTDSHVNPVRAEGVRAAPVLRISASAQLEAGAALSQTQRNEPKVMNSQDKPHQGHRHNGQPSAQPWPEKPPPSQPQKDTPEVADLKHAHLQGATKGKQP